MTYTDPGAIAVAGGLAHRDPDGSVVFDLGPALLPPSQHEPVTSSATSTSPPLTVQRQETSEPADEPASTVPAPTTAPVTASTTAPSETPTGTPATTPAGTPAATAATPPLDELARQLFGPLSARLKAELRLDRERAGLLTDLRQ
jgi:hypothetical protein